MALIYISVGSNIDREYYVRAGCASWLNILVL